MEVTGVYCIRRRRYNAASERGSEDTQHSVAKSGCTSDPEEDSSAHLSTQIGSSGSQQQQQISLMSDEELCARKAHQC